jgi:hypothetical protein
MPRQHTNYRTACYLRELGFTTVTVQIWNAAARVRQDMCGVFDLLAFHPQYGIIVAQAMTKTHLQPHRVKVAASPEAIKWLKSTGKAFLFSWRKVGAASKGERLLWRPRIEQAVLKRGKIVFVRIQEIPVLGQPDPTIVVSAKEKRRRALLKREQEAVQAQVVTILVKTLAEEGDQKAA